MSTLDSAHYFQNRWDLWKSAKPFADLVSKGDYTLTFTLGRDDFGFAYGNTDRRYTGPALDLTGATVKIKGRVMPYPPSIVDHSRGIDWFTGITQFEVTGTVTDAANGVCTFALSTTQTDVVGEILAAIEVEDASGNKIYPGHVRIKFLENLF